MTYSVDTAPEMVPFVEFLTKHGFCPAVRHKTLCGNGDTIWMSATSFVWCSSVTFVCVVLQIDIFDNPVRRMDINMWMDGYLKDVCPSCCFTLVYRVSNHFVVSDTVAVPPHKSVGWCVAEINTYNHSHQSQVQDGHWGIWSGCTRPAHQIHPLHGETLTILSSPALSSRYFSSLQWSRDT